MLFPPALFPESLLRLGGGDKPEPGIRVFQSIRWDSFGNKCVVTSQYTAGNYNISNIKYAYLTAFLVSGEYLGMSDSGWRHSPCISPAIWSHASLNTLCVFRAWPGLAVVQAVKRWPSTVEVWLRHLDVSVWDLWCSVTVVQISVRVLCFFLYIMSPMLGIRTSLDARCT
jgi:hypothetical protein